MKRILIALVIAALVASASLTLLAFSPAPDDLDGGFVDPGEEDLVFSKADHIDVETNDDEDEVTIDGVVCDLEKQSSDTLKLMCEDGSVHYLYRVGSDDYHEVVEK